MPKKNLTLIIALLLLVPSPASSAAPGKITDQDGWRVVEALPKGENIEIELKNSEKLKGSLDSVTNTELTIRESGQIRQIRREDIRTIHQLVGKSRGKSALRGAAIGGAIGVGSGLILYLPNRDDIVGWVVPAFGAIGAGIGAGVGSVFGGGKKTVLIYQA